MTRPAAAIVCLSTIDWHNQRYRKQHLMSRLARHMPVVFVNPLRPCKAHRPDRWNMIEQAAPNLQVLEPIVLPGAGRWPAVAALNRHLLARGIRSALPGVARRIVWACAPDARPLVDRIEPSFVVYDMADSCTGPAPSRDGVDSREPSMLERANLVFCVSEPIAAYARRFHPAVHVVPNGSDYQAYDAAAPAAAAGRPRIGYVGSVVPRIDVDLLVALATERPEWDIEVVGPVSPLVPIARASHLPNLLWTGQTPYERVAETIARFDVGILPLREQPFSVECSPIQVFDYLAAGKPVVSTPVGQLARWPELIRMARGADAFAQAVEAALADRSPARDAARKAFARVNSWDSRVDVILDLLARSGAVA